MIFSRGKRFRVDLVGTHLLIPVEDAEEPIVCFRAVRFVRAATPEEARARAISRLRSEWLSSPFSAVNRSGEPAIRVEKVEQVRGIFSRSRPDSGYTFYRHGDPDGVSP